MKQEITLLRTTLGFHRGLMLLVSMALVCLTLLSSVANAAPDQPFRIQSIGLDPTGSTLLIRGDQPVSTYNQFSALKLVGPYRLVIDVPDAVLSLPISTVPIHREGVEKVEISQSRGTFYNSVRITIHTQNYETLNRLNTSIEGNALSIHLTTPPVSEAPKSTLPTGTAEIEKGREFPLTPAFSLWESDRSAPSGMNVIRDVYFRDRQLVIVADPQHSEKLLVKNRFTLSEPSRLVIDLDRAMVSSKTLLGEIDVNNDPDIRQIRIGQFDEETVRLVIETRSPERFNLFYPSVDKRHLTVSAIDDVSMITLPRDTQMGALQNIGLDMEKGVTVLRLSSTAPVVHRVIKRDDKVIVEMLNIAARQGGVGFDRPHFPQIESMSVESLAVGQPNSKFVVDLQNPYWEVDTRLVDNGKTLELALLPPSLSPLKISKAPFAARVVVDAGHGGKDQGASRGGVLEKHLNLQVAMRLKRALEARGLKVYMTRDHDEYLTLSRITQITNQIRPDVFVSVHHNASNNPAIRGIETYYYTPQSRPLADKIHRKMVNHVKSPDRGVRRAMFYVIHHTNVPAVLCEVGYVSNPSELRELSSEQRQAMEADAIAEGVVEYLKSRVSAQAH